MSFRDTSYTDTSIRSNKTIKELQGLLHRIYSFHHADTPEEFDKNPAASSLSPILAALNWGGNNRHLQEALPYFDVIKDFDDLRAVLARLNFRTRKKKVNLSIPCQHLLPCLFVTETGNVYTIISYEGDGRYYIFDGEKEEFCSLHHKQIVGNSHTLEPIDFETDLLKSAKYGWLQVIFGKFKKTFLNLLLISFCINLFALFIPLYIMNVYDKVIGAESYSTLIYLAIGIIVALVGEIMFRILRARTIAYLGARLGSIFVISAFKQLLCLPVAASESVPVGSQIARLKQFESIRDIFTGAIVATILDLPFLIFFIAVIFAIGGPLGWIPVSLICVYAIIASISFPMSKAAVLQLGDAKTKRNNFLNELLQCQSTIHNNDSVDTWLSRYRAMTETLINKQFRMSNFDFVVQTIAQSIMTIAGLAMIGLGTIFVMEGQMSGGALIALMILIWKVLAPIQSAFLSAIKIHQMVDSLKQINYLMKFKTEYSYGKLPTIFRSFNGDIKINNIAFRYGPKSDPTLRNISLDIKAGEVIAITGPSGAGKSTLIKLLLGLYQPQAGNIKLDALDLRQIDLKEVRHGIGYAPQDLNFFYGTVLQNITFSNPQISKEEVLDVINALGFSHTIGKLENGIDTRIKVQDIHKFDLGFLQLLSLTRAMVQKTNLYLLDEPGQYLDWSQDKAFRNKITEMKRKATIVIVTHRPDHMRLADRLVVLSNGIITANGEPEDIINKIVLKDKKQKLA